MIAGVIIGIGISALVVWLLVWINSGVIGLVLSSIDIPEKFQEERKRERFLRRLGLAGAFLGYYGIALLGPAYVIGWFRHLKNNRQQPQPKRVGIIPQFTLSDLLTLVFSLGFFPVITQELAPIRQQNAAAIFMAAAVAFPAYFACGLYRTQILSVPRGGVRTALLAIIPYLFCAVPAVLVFPLALLSVRFAAINPPLYFVFNLAVIITAGILARKAQEQSLKACTPQTPADAPIEPKLIEAEQAQP